MFAVMPGCSCCAFKPGAISWFGSGELGSSGSGSGVTVGSACWMVCVTVCAGSGVTSTCGCATALLVNSSAVMTAKKVSRFLMVSLMVCCPVLGCSAGAQLSVR